MTPGRHDAGISRIGEQQTRTTQALKDLVYLADTWKWFGQHTGYSQLARETTAGLNDPHVIPSRSGRKLEYLRSRLYGFARGAWCCAGSDRQAEVEFLAAWQQLPRAIGHVLFFERHHSIFSQWEAAPARLVTTIHHPPNQLQGWHSAVLSDLKRVSSAITLYRRDVGFYERYVGRGRVRFIHHGVDTDFFSPGFRGADAPVRLLFVGINGRNTAMLQRVIQKLLSVHPEIQFDFLLPGLRQKPQESLKLARLWHNPKVTWHSGVSDEVLRALYRESYLLLLPLDHAGACNAIVEALGCGLPVVTTDVGGVRDYGGATVYPVVENNKDDDMIDLIREYLAKPNWYQQVASSCRRFAEETLSWPKVRQIHLETYLELAD